MVELTEHRMLSRETIRRRLHENKLNVSGGVDPRNYGGEVRIPGGLAGGGVRGWLWARA